ncbi:MAG: DUF1828 domain-containing protein [Acidobacteria bacterium]|nr:DUF1828 domain-containing protein [Acidobacteriota bacterium]
MNVLDTLRREFNGRVAFRERRPGVVQVLAPLFHEDGDMVDIFLDLADGNGKVRISDHGLTLMRLSFNLDVDTESRQRIFTRILSENRLQEQDGRLFLETEPDRLYPAILQFAQTVAKVSSMQYYRREVIQSLFYELLEQFILENLAEYNPRPRTLPIPEHDEYEVDFQFDINRRPLFLFGVRDNAKARLVTISCLEFMRRRIPFKSVIVHEDFEAGISRRDRQRITSASDKQFPSLDDFRENAGQFFAREASP